MQTSRSGRSPGLTLTLWNHTLGLYSGMRESARPVLWGGQEFGNEKLTPFSSFASLGDEARKLSTNISRRSALVCSYLGLFFFLLVVIETRATVPGIGSLYLCKDTEVLVHVEGAGPAVAAGCSQHRRCC